MPRSLPKTKTGPGLTALALAALVAGCDSNPFVPAPPPELAALADPKPASAVTSVAIVLAPGTSAERDTWAQSARLEASRAKVLFSESRPAPSDPPGRQAALIRAAAAKQVSALVVEPVDAPDVAEALDDARAAGRPVLLVGRRVAGRDPGRPFPLVAFEPFNGPARKLVGTVRKGARAGGLPDDGHALIAVKAGYGPVGEETITAFQAALRADGVRDVRVVRFGDGADAAKAAVRAGIEADPKVTMVLSVDGEVVTAALDAHDALRATREFLVAGVLSTDQEVNNTVLSACSGLVNRNPRELGRRAFRQALRLARGETVAPTDEVPTPFLGRSSGSPSIRPGEDPGVIARPPKS